MIVSFHTGRAELARRIPKLRAAMEPAAGLWIAWPKQASKVPTDLNGNVVRELALANVLVDNKVAALDETWSRAAIGDPAARSLVHVARPAGMRRNSGRVY